MPEQEGFGIVQHKENQNQFYVFTHSKVESRVFHKRDKKLNAQRDATYEATLLLITVDEEENQVKIQKKKSHLFNVARPIFMYKNRSYFKYSADKNFLTVSPL